MRTYPRSLRSFGPAQPRSRWCLALPKYWRCPLQRGIDEIPELHRMHLMDVAFSASSHPFVDFFRRPFNEYIDCRCTIGDVPHGTMLDTVGLLLEDNGELTHWYSPFYPMP